MISLVLYAIVSTALWYLGSRALITKRLWSHYPPRFTSFMDCPACVGFWWGLILSFADQIHEGHAHPVLPIGALSPFVVGLCMIVLVPFGAGLLQRALWEAGSAADAEKTDGE